MPDRSATYRITLQPSLELYGDRLDLSTIEVDATIDYDNDYFPLNDDDEERARIVGEMYGDREIVEEVSVLDDTLYVWYEAIEWERIK